MTRWLAQAGAVVGCAVAAVAQAGGTAGAQAAADAGALKSSGLARLHVFGDLYLADPWFLLLVPLCAALAWYGRSRAARAAARVPGLPQTALPRTWPQRLAFLPAALSLAAAAGAAVALARPVRANVLKSTTSEGVDIALVLDRSSTMRFQDLERGRSRLDVVKDVVGDFARRRMTDEIGASDNVALLAFAAFPQLLCPFTLDVGALTGFLEQVQIVRNEAEDGTAIGLGLAKAVALLKESDAKSKVVVLLTDGENNRNEIEPLDAGKLAAELGVRVYTVLAGRYVMAEDPFGRVVVTEQVLDSSDLRKIAQMTGGRFFEARDRDGLERIYAEIEVLERTPRTERRFTETFDLYPALLLAALACHVLAWLVGSTLARTLP